MIEFSFSEVAMAVIPLVPTPWNGMFEMLKKREPGGVR